MLFLQTPTTKPVLKEFIKDGKSTISRVDAFWDNTINWLSLHIPEIIIGFLLFYVGKLLIRLLIKWLNKWMLLRNYDQSIIPFVKSVTTIALNVFLFLSVLGFVGVNTTSFLTILGAAGLAIGLALQGSLSNFAGGVLILIFKPFVVGNYIKIGTFSGTVKEIDVLYTFLLMDDNKTAILPNGKITNTEVVNYSLEDLRRVDIRFVLDYSTDLFKAKSILNEILNTSENINLEKNNIVGASELIDSGVKMDYLIWVKREDYLETKQSLIDKIVTAFKLNEISFAGSAPTFDVKFEK